MSEKTIVAIVCEEEFNGLVEVDGDKSRASSWCSGFSEGAGNYGGCGSAFVLPDEFSEIEEWYPELVAQIRERYEEKTAVKP